MGQKFYSEIGERDVLSPKILKISKECIKDRRRIYIPELHLIAYSKANETIEETRRRYFRNTLTFRNLANSDKNNDKNKTGK